MTNKLRTWFIPLGLLVVLIISFGLLIPWLGFYWDDWSALLVARMRGLIGFWDYYAFDRPVSAWTYVVSFPFLGMNPALWQIFALLLRWGTTFAAWWALSGLWPQRKREVALISFLFAIYPVFDQQSSAVAFSQHWTCFFLYCLSIAWMIWAWRNPKRFWLFTILSVATSILQMTTMEYFVGLELLRPVLLWVLASERDEKLLARLKTVGLKWLPYLLGLIAFAIWRLFFLKIPGGDPNAPSLLYLFTSSPLTAIFQLLVLVMQDLSYIVITAWSDFFQAANIQLTEPFTLFSWGIGLLLAGALFFFLRSFFGKSEPESGSNEKWPLYAIGIGLAGIIFGVLPIWVTNRQVMSGLYSDRFGLPAMLGASILVVGLICWAIPSTQKQFLLISLLVGLAAGQHIRTANDYRWSWVKQTRFYWQLSWRAPAIQPRTPIFAAGEIFQFMSRNATTSALDILYPPANLPLNELPYYFYSLGRDYRYNIDDFAKSNDVHAQSYRIFTFNGNTDNAVIVDYEDGCVHVLSPQDGDAPKLSPYSAKAVVSANLNRIQANPTTPGYPQTGIFGPEPRHDWCYLYEKADLARQMGDYKQVVELGNQAKAMKYTPKTGQSNNPFEWLPFIEGYARTGQWQVAKDLSQAAHERDKAIDASLCKLWTRLGTTADVSAARDSAVKAAKNQLSCSK